MNRTGRIILILIPIGLAISIWLGLQFGTVQEGLRVSLLLIAAGVAGLIGMLYGQNRGWW
jgi:hypothetical protein